MASKKTVLTWISGFIVLFGLNGLFHLKIAGSVFDQHLAHLAPVIIPMKNGNPLPVALLDLVIAFTMVYFISKTIKSEPNLWTGIRDGALINFTTSVVFNFANSAMFNWPGFITILDISWHSVLGGLVGGIMAWSLLRKSRL